MNIKNLIKNIYETSSPQSARNKIRKYKDDVLNLGEENFTREIIKLCKSKGECSYYEAKYQFDHNVLLRKDEFYNGWISCKIHSNHIKI